jgi:hypothetical protein
VKNRRWAMCYDVHNMEEHGQKLTPKLKKEYDNK